MRKWTIYLAAICAMLFWALTFVWIKIALITYRPYEIVFLRLLLASALLTGVILLFRKRERIERRDLLYLMLVAFFEPFLYFLGEANGMRHVSSTLGSLIISTIPLVTALGAWLVLKEKITPFLGLGLLVSFSGVALLSMAEPDLSGLFSSIGGANLLSLYRDSIVLMLKPDSNDVLFRSKPEAYPYWEFTPATPGELSMGGQRYAYEGMVLTGMNIRLVVITPTRVHQGPLGTFRRFSVTLFLLVLLFYVVRRFWEYRAVFRSDSPPEGLGPPLILPLLPVAVLGIVILFTVAVSFGILRSLGRSMGKLEEATRRIAAGDLDFEPALPAGDSLASLAASMDAMRLRLKEEYQRRDRFILAVSHDLKTPLAVLEGYLDAFADGLADSPEKRESYLRVLREKTGVLSHRISHLVELARMTTVEWRQTFEDCDLSAFLKETLGLLSDEAAARGRRMEVDFRLSPGRRSALNRDMARRVLENLADNAETYSPPDSVLRASAREEGAEVLVRISNEGEGIPAERRGLVFEPFYRGDPGRNAGGFGLGLASVKSIVEAHGWGIDLESVPGGTTSFTVRIPTSRP